MAEAPLSLSSAYLCSRPLLGLIDSVGVHAAPVLSSARIARPHLASPHLASPSAAPAPTPTSTATPTPTATRTPTATATPRLAPSPSPTLRWSPPSLIGDIAPAGPSDQLEAISCPSTSLCVAGDGGGDILCD